MSDGASAHFKNNLSVLNLAHHDIDFGLDAAWTFSEAGHGKGVEDSVDGFPKSTVRRANMSKDVRLFSLKDFYDFLKKHQSQNRKLKSTGKALVTF
jgi:hypothetical protein